ncbi:MAG: glycosyltransferase [Nitrospiraceae bacterium]|nr:MAG: glycosyltransferase [Nitrospiraceae bacterium]
MEISFDFLRRSISTDYDVLFLQKTWIFTFPCVLAAKIRGKKVVMDMDDLDSFWQHNRIKTVLTMLGEKVMPYFADALTTHNKYLMSYLESRFKRPLFLLPQGVETGLFDPAHFNREEEKKRLGLTDKTVLCFLGSFTVGSARDLDAIIKAFSEVSREIDEAVLMIIGGGGPLEEAYLKMIEDMNIKSKTIVTGHMDQENIPGYLSACDYGLIFMRNDLANQVRVSLKLREYLSMDLTVIGHVVGSSKDDLGKQCFLCEENVTDFAETIRKVIKYKLKHNTTHEFVNNKYDWNSFLPHVKNFLNTIH